MHRPLGYRRKDWRRALPSAVNYRPPWWQKVRGASIPSAFSTRRERLWFGGLVVFVVVAFLALIHFTATFLNQRDRERYLLTLKSTYALSDEQISAIRKIENEYHGMGGLLTPSRKHEEKIAHRIAISEQMNRDTGTRYLADLNRQGPSMQKSKQPH